MFHFFLIILYHHRKLDISTSNITTPPNEAEGLFLSKDPSSSNILEFLEASAMSRVWSEEEAQAWGDGGKVWGACLSALEGT